MNIPQHTLDTLISVLKTGDGDAALQILLVAKDEDRWHYDTIMAAPEQAPEHIRKQYVGYCLDWAETAFINDDFANAASFANDAVFLCATLSSGDDA